MGIPVAQRLQELAESCDAWAAVLLLLDDEGIALHAVMHHGLPDDWMGRPNRLDSGSMNARAFVERVEVVEDGLEEWLPPGGVDVTPHRMTAAAVVLLGEVGTLEVIADSDGFRFDERKLQLMRATASDILEALQVTQSSK